DEQNLEVLLIDGQPLKTLRGQLGALGGIDMDTAKLLTRGQITYAEGSPPGSYDPGARLRVMDGEGIDQDLEMPVAFHVVVRDRPWSRQWQRGDPSDGLFSIAFLAIDVMAAFTQMLSAGMFDRYPRLRCVVLEAGSNWIAAWLDRLDHKHRVLAHQTPIKMA